MKRFNLFAKNCHFSKIGTNTDSVQAYVAHYMKACVMRITPWLWIGVVGSLCWLIFGKWLLAEAYEYPPKSSYAEQASHPVTLQPNAAIQTSKASKESKVSVADTSTSDKTTTLKLPLALQQAMTLYKQGQAQACYEKLASLEIEQNNPSQETNLIPALIGYYKGLSAIQLGYYQEAYEALTVSQTVMNTLSDSRPKQTLQRYVQEALKLLPDTSAWFDAMDTKAFGTGHIRAMLDAPPHTLPTITPIQKDKASIQPTALPSSINTANRTNMMSPEQQAQMMQQYQLQQLMGILGNNKNTPNQGTDPMNMLLMMQQGQGLQTNNQPPSQGLDPQLVQTVLQNQMLNGMELFTNDKNDN
jgi:hypothetical protein